MSGDGATPATNYTVPATTAATTADSADEPRLLFTWGDGRYRAVQKDEESDVFIEEAHADNMGGVSWRDLESEMQYADALELLCVQTRNHVCHQPGATLILTCRVLETIDEDAGRRGGVVFLTSDGAEIVVACDKETVSLAGKHFTEEVELIFRPKP